MTYRSLLRGLMALISFLVIALLIVLSAQPAHAAVRKWNRDVVYVQNELPSTWPTLIAAEVWDDSSDLEIIVLARGKRCSAYQSCIVVKLGRLSHGTLGYTEMSWTSDYRYKRSVITISDRIVSSYDQKRRRILIAHEIGHAVGFAHVRDEHDVMHQYIRATGSYLPSDRQKSVLAEAYGR